MKYGSRLLMTLALLALLCGGIARGQALPPRVVPEATGNNGQGITHTGPQSPRWRYQHTTSMEAQ